MKFHKADPRVKFIITAFITSIGVISSNTSLLLTNFIIALVYAWLFNVKLGHLIKRFRKILYLLLFLILIQSIFTRDGAAILEVFGIKMITDTGLTRGIGYFFRVTTILLSGTILATSNSADVLRGFSKLGMPYELTFTTLIGIRFLPVFVEEVKNAYTAIQLRGIDFNKLKLKKRIEIISYLFLPIIYSTITRSKKLAESVETRGFKVGGKRTWYKDIKLAKNDYIIGFTAVIIFASAIYYFKLKGDYYESFISSWLY